VYVGANGTPGTSADDSYPGDRLSPIFGGGIGSDGMTWLQGVNSKFQVRPVLPLFTAPQGKCDGRKTQTSHDRIQVATADGSVHAIGPNITATIWAALLTPSGGETIPDDWEN